MDNYEKTISLKLLFMMLVRRIHIFFVIFIPIGIISYIVTNQMLTKTYISSITVSRGAVVDVVRYAVIQSYVKSFSDDEEKPGAIYMTAMSLKDEGITHKNGSEITIEDIYSGISFTALANNTIYVTFSFQSTDNTITQKVLNELAKNAILNLKAYAGADYKYMEITGNGATNPTKNSKETTYFLITLAAGFVVAFGICFVDEIIGDEVYDKHDIENLGCSAFEISTKPKKKEA